MKNIMKKVEIFKNNGNFDKKLKNVEKLKNQEIFKKKLKNQETFKKKFKNSCKFRKTCKKL